MAASSARSTGWMRRRRHASEHQRTSSQPLASERRQVMLRPQPLQTFGAGGAAPAKDGPPVRSVSTRFGYCTDMTTSSALMPLSAAPSRRRRLAAAILALSVMLVGCGRGGSDDTDLGAPSVEPGQAIPVSGRSGLVLWDLSPSGTYVFVKDSEEDAPVPADSAAITAAADAIKAWLDTVLSERNRGETTTVDATEVDGRAFATAIGADGPQTDGFPNLQVSGATYLIEIGYLGKPGWAQARVESTLTDTTGASADTVRLDTFLFAIDESGGLEFLGLEVAP